MTLGLHSGSSGGFLGRETTRPRVPLTASKGRMFPCAGALMRHRFSPDRFSFAQLQYTLGHCGQKASCRSPHPSSVTGRLFGTCLAPWNIQRHSPTCASTCAVSETLFTNFERRRSRAHKSRANLLTTPTAHDYIQSSEMTNNRRENSKGGQDWRMACRELPRVNGLSAQPVRNGSADLNPDAAQAAYAMEIAHSHTTVYCYSLREEISADFSHTGRTPRTYYERYRRDEL